MNREDSFDMHYYKVSIGHNALSLPPLTPDIFQRFSSNSAKFSGLLENAVCYSLFYENHSLDGVMDADWSGK